MAEDIKKYMDGLQNKLSNRDYTPRQTQHLADFPLVPGQCIYVINYKTKTVSFQKGILQLLGYTPEEYTFELALDNFHPNDREIVTRLIKGTLLFASENNVSGDVAFFVTYRIKHKNNNYIKVLRQSTVFDVDDDQKIISNISLLTDISYLQSSDKVEWKFEAEGLDKKKFDSYIRASYIDFFTERELQIIELIKRGLTSIEIGEKLSISKHTVDTHRRNLLKKTNSANSMELLNFYTQHII